MTPGDEAVAGTAEAMPVGGRMSPDELRGLFLFETFSEEQLRWLSERSEALALDAGAALFAEGDDVDALWVLIEGQWRLSRHVAGREVVLELSDQRGSWGGWLPMFDGPSALGGRLVRPSRVLRIPREAVRHMLDAGFPVATHLLAGLYGGVQHFEAVTRQQEKLAALGKLSAGLAHELNNPAAAARRAASQLRKALRARGDHALTLGGRLDPPAAAWLVDFGRAAVERAANAPSLDPLAQSDREDELAGWLERHGIGDAWDLAPTLADAGLDRADLDDLAGHVAADALSGALAWLGGTLALDELVHEVETSTGRISELVGAIKEYTYMDQAPEQEVDIHDGIENTLTILGHKLRGIALTRDYDRNLPRVYVHGSELNQVWTNLLDNAIDALADQPAGEGRLVVRTARDGDGVLVEVADNGPGIPPELQGRIFEPFFTTKAVGQGTGLGLDTSRRIVVERHGGEIEVLSQPGETRFRVHLPLAAPED